MLKLDKPENRIYLLIGIVGRIVLIFVETVLAGSPFATSEASSSSLAPSSGEVSIELPVGPSPEAIVEQIPEYVLEDIDSVALDEETQLSVSEELQLEESQLDAFALQSTGSSTLEDIALLKKLYVNAQSDELLILLIHKLVEDYQFDEAYDYAKKLIKSSDISSLDPHLYLQILINSDTISLMNEQSIDKIKPILDEYRVRGLLSMDDYRFYNGIIALWYLNYDEAETLFKQITAPRYEALMDEFIEIKKQTQIQRDMPSYYYDSLISLTLLKNGFFTPAKKLALHVLELDGDYILPYQVLAYANLLTNDWEAAIDYFFKLSSYDKWNEMKYKFLIGISYYWLERYEQSVLHLKQVEELKIRNEKLENLEYFDDGVLGDTYRYLILNYIAGNDLNNAISTWQKLLWSPSLEKADYYTYFYEAFFKPLIESKDYELFEKNTQLADAYVQSCYKQMPESEQDICIYGHAGLDNLMHKPEEAKQKLFFLAKEYPQAYIFHTLGDYYFVEWNMNKAKAYYIKAASMAENENEMEVLKNKLTHFGLE